MNTTQYAPAAVAIDRPNTGVDWIDGAYAPAIQVVRAATTEPERERATIDDVEDLLAAAGPLTMLDIAGALDVSLTEASVLVGTLQYAGCIREDEDEWGRYALADDFVHSGGEQGLEQHEQRRALVHALADGRIDGLDRAVAPRP